MFQGELIGIYLTPEKATPLRPVPEARAVAGKGLDGDRYGTLRGTFSKAGKASQQVTLIECEAVEAVARDYGVALDYSESRRNLVTRGVPLNHLLGREFTVGSVRLRGLKLCEPCAHLEKLTRPGIEKALRHRGGLCAEIVEGGVLKVGDAIRPA